VPDRPEPVERTFAMSDPPVSLRRTPLFDLHRERHGRMVDFAGWSLPVRFDPGPVAEPWLRPHLERVEAVMLERVAARRTREIQTIFAEVLREMQAEGDVLVTLERRQPVYHITVVR
ncbi:MAG: DUF5715 family protein, partial [Gemmatimonadota bacterium]